MPATPVPLRIRAAQTAAYFLFYVAIGLILSAIGPSLPSLAGQTGSLLGQLGVLFTALSLGRLVSALALGRLFDRVPAHPLMAAMLAAICLLVAVIPLLRSLTALTAVFFAIGLPWGVMDVGVNTLIAWIWGERSAPFLNGLHLCFGAGAIVAPLMVNTAWKLTASTALAYWIIAGLLLVVLLLTVSLPSPRIITQAEDRRAGEKSRGFFVTGIMLLILICVGEEVAFSGWIFSYATKGGLATQDQAALLNSLFWAALLCGRLAGIVFAARISARRFLWLDLLGCLAAVGMILLWPGARLAVWAGTLLLGFSIASIFPMTIVYTGQRVLLTSKITGLIIVGDAIGGMLLPWLAGVLFANAGPTWMLLQIFACFLAALVIYSLLDRPVKRGFRMARSSTE